MTHHPSHRLAVDALKRKLNINIKISRKLIHTHKFIFEQGNEDAHPATPSATTRAKLLPEYIPRVVMRGFEQGQG